MSNLAELPTRKQDYVKERIAGKNKMQSALAAGYSVNSARTAVQSIETPDVKAVFRALVARAAPMTKLAATLAAGLDATSVSRAQQDGKFTDERKDPDFAQRRAYASLVAEYAGYVEKDAPALSVQIGSLSLALPEVEQPAVAQPVIELAPTTPS